MSRPSPVLVTAGLLCAVTACAGSPAGHGGQGGDLAQNATFTMAVKQDFGSFDPYTNPNVLSYTPLAYDSLVNLQPDGKFVSGLAEKWTADPKTATFTLRQGITCSDGSPLTAGQVAAVLGYVSDPKNKSVLAGVRVPTVPLKAVGDDAARTVKVTLDEPYGFLLNTIGQVPIACAKDLSQTKSLATTSNGTGPYVLTSALPGQSLTFTVRKGYSWGPNGARTDAPGMPARIVIRFIESETTRANLLLAGQLNFAQIQGEDAARLDARGLTKIKQPTPGSWLRFNENRGRPTADPKVRQALVQALNRDELVKVSTGGKGRAATGLVVLEPKPCAGDTVTGAVPAPDPAAAAAALDAAGWKQGAGGVRSQGGKPLTIGLHYLAGWSIYSTPTAEYLAQQWRKLGVNVKLGAETLVGLTDTMFKTGNWDIEIDGQGMSLPTQVVAWYSGATPPDGKNVGATDNKDFLSLSAQAKALPADQSCGYWTRAEQALIRRSDVVPVSDRYEYLYAYKAQFQHAAFMPAIPTTIRVLR